MQGSAEIGFDQLVQLVRQLPENQWRKLKAAVENEDAVHPSSEMLDFLMNAPTFSKAQLEEINQARKEISQWRTD